jgi:hypothetical protein
MTSIAVTMVLTRCFMNFSLRNDFGVRPDRSCAALSVVRTLCPALLERRWKRDSSST